MQANNLAYIAVVSKDVAKAETLFEKTLGLTRTDVAAGNGRTAPVFSVGQSAIALFEAGDPFVDGQDKAGVHHIAFGDPQPEQAAARVALTGIAVSGEAHVGLGGKTRVGLSPQSTSGVKAYFTQALDIERTRSGKVERVDHIGIASADNRAAVATFCGKLGLPLESQQTDMEVQIAVESFTSDKYGAVYHSRAPQLVGGLRVAFITAGDCELEFLQNFDPAQSDFIQHGAAGTTRQDQGAITRYIASRGAGLHHVAFKVPDINAVLAALNEQGFATIDRVGRPGSRRALIGFVQPKSLGGILIHFVQRD